MKTALILTGHMRCWQKVFKNTKDHILDIYNPDVFIATWDREGYWTAPEDDPDNIGVHMDSPSLDIVGVREHYKPKAMTVLDQDHYFPLMQNLARLHQYEKIAKEIRVSNIVSQFHMMKTGYELWTAPASFLATNNYDLVIRMRPDLIFPQGLPHLDPNNVYTLAHPNHEGKGVGDMFLASSGKFHQIFKNAMDNYGGIAKHELKRFCPHMITEAVISDLVKMENDLADAFGTIKMEWHNLTIPKVIQHTPNGQYQPVKRIAQ